jgi:hypothetical protein
MSRLFVLQLYTDHAPLFASLASTNWTLVANPATLAAGTAASVAVNVFDAPGAVVVVVLDSDPSGTAADVAVALARVPDNNGTLFDVAVGNPGQGFKPLGDFAVKDGVLSITAPLLRNVAVIRVTPHA